MMCIQPIRSHRLMSFKEVLKNTTQFVAVHRLRGFMKEKKTNPPTYREKRRENSVKKFLNGEARHPYVLREDIVCGLKSRTTQLDDSMEEQEVSVNSIKSKCTCQETLGQFSDMFKSMVHTGQKLVNRASNQKYQDTNRQNQWLLNNVFDLYGNYIYCFCCIKDILGVSGKRLHRLREIKRQQANAPKIQMRKDQVPIEQIGDIIPPVSESNVLSWWMNLENSSIVELRSVPKVHCGKSNYSKEELLPYFLDFIDNNSQPNGRRVGSHGPLFFLNSKFDRINEPYASEIDKPEQWKRRSLVYEFNRSLSQGLKISNGTAKKWLKTYRPKHAISPKKTDYCEMCVECQEQKRRYETISMRLQQNGNAYEDEIRENQALAESYGLLLEEHKMDAGSELQHYREQIQKCQTLYQHIEKLLSSRSKTKFDRLKLQELKEQVVGTISIDYQQSLLIPHWGCSPQPSETYYLRKLSHNIFGIVDHTVAKNTIYVLDERVGGAKNGDITISLVDHYIQRLPSWVRHLCFFMDNGATNKNQFMIQWGMELVEKSDYDSIRMCFVVKGHAKSDVDRLFARISHTFDNNDVFATEHLITLIQKTIGAEDTCVHINNRNIVNWKGLLEKKYTALKDIKSYRDFLIRRNPDGKIVVNCKTCCYKGEYVCRELKKEVGNLDLRAEIKNFTYEAKGMSKDLSQEKVADLVKMYNKFIDPILRPEWLPTSQPIETPHLTISSPSSELARQHQEALKRKNKKTN